LFISIRRFSLIEDFDFSSTVRLSRSSNTASKAALIEWNSDLYAIGYEENGTAQQIRIKKAEIRED
jgi:hypothetical protein